eukprot:SAG31_NODE_7343_length_1713_cov_3.416357_2_plen_67_part_00
MSWNSHRYLTYELRTEILREQIVRSAEVEPLSRSVESATVVSLALSSITQRLVRLGNFSKSFLRIG